MFVSHFQWIYIYILDEQQHKKHQFDGAYLRITKRPRGYVVRRVWRALLECLENLLMIRSYAGDEC